MPDMTPTPTPLEALAEAIDRVADLGGERDEWYTDADGMAENVIEWVAAAGLRLVPANAPDPDAEAREPLRKALDVKAIAHKAAEIGYTYGALGRDFEYVYKNVDDLLLEADA